MKPKLYLTTQQIKEWIDNLVDQIKVCGKQYSHVVGIREGGINISQPLAKALDLCHYTVKISYYDAPGIVESDNYQGGSGGLVVDDLIDTGRTMRTFQQTFGQHDIAVLLWDQEREPKAPAFYAALKPKDWVVFPWEVE